MYADTVTRSMRRAIDETERRRKKQIAWNETHGVVPKTIIKDVRDIMQLSEAPSVRGKSGVRMTESERKAEIARLEKQMKEAARLLEFELAAELRDQIIMLQGK